MKSETPSDTPVLEKEPSLGQYLKAQREMRQVSHDEIARVTKINVGILRNIEADAWEELPSRPFLRGFLTSIGQYLGLDTHDLLLRYEQEATQRGAPAQQWPTFDPGSRQMRAPAPSVSSSPGNLRRMDQLPVSSSMEKWFNRKTIPVFVTIVIVVVVLSLLKSVGEKDMNPPQENTEVQANQAEPPPPVPEEHELKQPPPAGASQKTETAAAPAPTTPDAAIPPPAPEAAKAAEPAPTPAAAPAPAPQTATPAATPPPAAGKPAATMTVQTAAVAGEQELVIKAKTDTFFKVQLPGNKIENISLRSGETTNLKAGATIKLLLLNAGSITITRNGEKLGSLGKWGESRIIEFPVTAN